MVAETVRRDLKVMEGYGLLRRTHGGAYPIEGVGYESKMAYRSESWIPEKRRIAAAAIEQLGPAETVYLDEGFTPQLVAQELVDQGKALTVVTSSLATAGILTGCLAINVILLGGRVRGRTLATVDHWATAMLGDLVIDVAIMGANGFTRDRGLTVADSTVAAVKAKAMVVSRRRIFVGVHTKFGVSSFAASPTYLISKASSRTLLCRPPKLTDTPPSGLKCSGLTDGQGRAGQLPRVR